MAHVRTQLRNAVIAALKAGVPEVNNRCDRARGFDRNRAKLPAIEVSTPSETVEGVTQGDAVLVRNVELAVSIYASERADTEDYLDGLAAKCEIAMHGDAAIQALIHDAAPENMSFEVVPGESRIGRMELTWAVIILTEDGDPETAI